MPKLAANLSFLFKDRPFLGRVGAAAAAGFRQIEFMFPGDGAYVHSAADVRSALEEHGLAQALLNSPAGDWGAGERGIAGLPHREDDFKASIETGLRYAETLRCHRMHVMAGVVAAGADEATLVRRLRWASEMAAAEGVTVLVEPLNAVDFPGYAVPDAATALRVLDEVGAPNCRLQLDLYHVAMGEAATTREALEPRLRALLPHAEHVQLANPPGRHEPGAGTVDFAPLLELLDGELGYDGVVGCEYKPSTPRTEDSLAWAAKWLRPP